MPTPIWAPGTLYPPGSLVQPRSAPPPVPDPVTNGDFELGNTGWTMAAGFSIGEFGNGTHFTGTWSLQWDATGNGRAINNNATQVNAGQVITGTCMVQQGQSSSGEAGARCEIAWYDASDELIAYAPGNLIDSGSNQTWKQSTVSAIAPANAAFARFSVYAFRTGGGDELWIDNCSWDAIISQLPTGLVFRAVQATAGYSGSNEPVWPVAEGLQVVDNEVTWEAVYASRVTWEATPILVSGEYEPEWPEVAGSTVADGTIQWTALTARVDSAPQSKITAIAASKVFKGDGDIASFSATANPLDRTTADDAGYIPFGLNTYGATPIIGFGLYRGNLVIFNSQGFQMWQVDQDPANMALLDAAPVPCEYKDTIQPVANDLVFLTSRGIRNIGIAGASTNLQAGFFGKQVDPLVLEFLDAATAAGLEPFALFYPGAGQYWLIFGRDVVVLTVNGGSKDMSWSRYQFPVGLTDWTIQGTELYVRAGDTVHQISAAATEDGQVCGFPIFTIDRYASYGLSSITPYSDGSLDTLLGFITGCTQSEDSIIVTASVGEGVQMRYFRSTDGGETWAMSSDFISPDTSRIGFADYGEGEYVFTGSTGILSPGTPTAAVSDDDGVTFTDATADIVAAFGTGGALGVTYTEGFFFTASDEGHIGRRPAGGNWDAVSTAAPTGVSRPRFAGNGSGLVVGLINGRVCVSEDSGTTWDCSSYVNAFASADLGTYISAMIPTAAGIAYGAGCWIACGTVGGLPRIRRSTVGAEAAWTDITVPEGPQRLDEVRYDPVLERFFISGSNITTGVLYVLQSEDGLTWSVATSYGTGGDLGFDITWLLPTATEQENCPAGYGGIGTPPDAVPFTGYLAWPYLDFGRLGVDKSLEGFDIVATGEFSISIGYNQRDTSQATAAYELDGDTLPGTMVPMPLTAPSMQMRITFNSSQPWEWFASTLYLTDQPQGM